MRGAIRLYRTRLGYDFRSAWRRSHAAPIVFHRAPCFSPKPEEGYSGNNHARIKSGKEFRREYAEAIGRESGLESFSKATRKHKSGEDNYDLANKEQEPFVSPHGRSMLFDTIG